jgi:hypothetical protein
MKLLVFFFFEAEFRHVDGYAYLFFPPSRNVNAHREGSSSGLSGSLIHCPHCGHGHGPATVKKKADGHWPSEKAFGSHGLCGDPWKFADEFAGLSDEPFMKYTNAPQKVYVANSTVEFLVAVSTHHQGHFDFSICNRKLDSTLGSHEDGQRCLNEYRLERADPSDAYDDCVADDPRPDCQPIDPKHPGRWYLPPPSALTQTAGDDWTQEAAQYLDGFSGSIPGGSLLYRMKYKIPADLHCAHCTLQWYWSAGNYCLFDSDYIDYFQKTFPSAGWTQASSWSFFATQSWAPAKLCGDDFPEEFRNCADIAVVSTGRTPPILASPTPPETAWSRLGESFIEAETTTRTPTLPSTLESESTLELKQELEPDSRMASTQVKAHVLRGRSRRAHFASDAHVLMQVAASFGDSHKPAFSLLDPDHVEVMNKNQEL